MSDDHHGEDYYWQPSQKAKHADKPYNDPRTILARLQTALGQIEAYIQAEPVDFKDKEEGAKAAVMKRKLLAKASDLAFKCDSYYATVTEDKWAASKYS
jgi:hypothetical protein